MLRTSLWDSCNNGPVTPSLRSPSLLLSPLLAPLPSSDEHPGISEAATRGPALSCERKLRNECHSLQGAQLQRQQNNGGRYERHGHTVHSHTCTHLQTHFSNTHQQLLDFRSNPALLVYCELNMILNESMSEISLRWSLKYFHVFAANFSQQTEARLFLITFLCLQVSSYRNDKIKTAEHHLLLLAQSYVHILLGSEMWWSSSRTHSVDLGQW